VAAGPVLYTPEGAITVTEFLSYEELLTGPTSLASVLFANRAK
jgi:hypothetical protein